MKEKGIGRDVVTTIHSLRGRLATSLPISVYMTFMLCCEIHFMGVSPEVDVAKILTGNLIAQDLVLRLSVLRKTKYNRKDSKRSRLDKILHCRILSAGNQNKAWAFFILSNPRYRSGSSLASYFFKKVYSGSSMGVFAIVFSLLTLALMLGLGILGRRLGLFAKVDVKVLGTFTYYFGLPALFFSSLSTLDFSQVDLAIVLGVLAPQFFLMLPIIILHLLNILSKDDFVILALSLMFGSYAFFGVPFFLSLYGEWGTQMSVLTSAVLSIYGILGSLMIFEYAVRTSSPLMSGLRIMKSPLFLSVILGIACSLLHFRLQPLDSFFILLGRTAPGTAIFMLGMFIYDHFSLAIMKKVMVFGLFRLLGLPLVTLTILILFWDGESALLKQFLLLHSGIPSAISIAVMAERYNYRIPEITGIVVLTSLFSFPVLALLFFLKI